MHSSLRRSSRREFLQASAGAALLAGLGTHVTGAEPATAVDSRPNSAFPLMRPDWELTICRWTAEHPRHDHQLIFPLSEGRLIFVWSEYYAVEPQHLARKSPSDAGGFNDEMPCRLSAKISTDKGRTWGEPRVIQENRWKLNVKHPNLLRLKSGEILFTFSGWDSLAQRNIFARRSADEGQTWTEAVQISAPGWYCTNNDHVLRLNSGRIVLPSHGVVGRGAYKFANSQLESFAFLSDDEGRTWRRSAESMTAPGRGAHEPSLVELKDGRLLALLRTTNACVYQSHSSDGDEHWTSPQTTSLPAPDSPPLVRRIPATGDLLLVWNRVASHKGTPRTPLTAAISRDEGQTWQHVQHIDGPSDNDAAYASVFFQDDEVLIAYYKRNQRWMRDSEVVLRAYPVKRFYQTQT